MDRIPHLTKHEYLCKVTRAANICPACAVVGGKKDAAVSSPGKEIRAADGKRVYVTAIRSIGLHPLSKQWMYAGRCQQYQQEKSS